MTREKAARVGPGGDAWTRRTVRMVGSPLPAPPLHLLEVRESQPGQAWPSTLATGV
jgi:hypothetical protein